MSNGDGQEEHLKAESGYRIRLKGQLPERYSSWFAPLTVSRRTEGVTVLEGRVADQPALHAVLRKIRDLGLTLVSVDRYYPEVEDGEEGAE